MNDFLNASRDNDARARLETKARGGIAEAQVLLGMHFQSEKNFPEMLSWFEKAAGQGDGQAMRNLGVCYRDAVGVTANTSQAMTWFRKAVDAGGAGAGDAALDIANLYSDGVGVAKDEAAAAEWYRKGADRGNAEAMNFLGASYWNGAGVEKSARTAIGWWKQAAEKGDANAKKNLVMALKKFDESGQPRTRK